MDLNGAWNVSLSTMWAMGGFTRLEDFFLAARQIGFAGIELNHQVNSAMLEGIDLSRYLLSSVHEPCPADVPVATLKERNWLISASDEECRKQGVHAVQRSIDLAHRLGVHTLVVHAGNVLPDNTLEKELCRLFLAGRASSAQYAAVKKHMLDLRARSAALCLEAVKKSLLDLLEYAARLDVCLGLENRYHYMDIPGQDEMELLLDLAGPKLLGFWYDVGHAEIMDRLGFFSHEAWLKRFSARLVGVHLHDVHGTTDHCAPGSGEVDFDQIAAYLPANAIRTFEIRAKTPPEQVKDSLIFLAEKGCIQCL